MSWQSERESWNQEGLCARQACKAELRESWRHPATGLLYCTSCHHKLEDAQPGLVMVLERHWTVTHLDTGAVYPADIFASNPRVARMIVATDQGCEPGGLRATRYVNPYKKEGKTCP